MRDSDILSIESLQVQPSAPINENSGNTTGFITYLPWILGGLGVLLLVGGGVWYWQMNKTPAQSAPKKRRRTNKPAIKSPEQVAAEKPRVVDPSHLHQHQLL